MSYIIVLLICAVGLAIDIWFIRTEHAGEMKKATILKGCASFFFVLLGFYLYVTVGAPVALPILIGLVLGMIGDILLNMRNLYEGATSNKVFALGILAFLAGHISYIVFLLLQAGSLWWLALVLTAFLAAAAIPPLMKRIQAPSEGLKKFGYVYLTIVIAMFASAIAMSWSLGLCALDIFILGAALFVVSDFIMIYNSFGGKPTYALRATNLLTYYVGQLIIAYCICLIY